MARGNKSDILDLNEVFCFVRSVDCREVESLQNIFVLFVKSNIDPIDIICSGNMAGVHGQKIKYRYNMKKTYYLSFRYVYL